MLLFVIWFEGGRVKLTIKIASAFLSEDIYTVSEEAYEIMLF